MSVAGATPLQRLVAERLGLQFDETRLPLLAELQRRHGGSQAQAQAAWLERLAHCATDSGPWLELAQDLTVTETSFLRYPEQFDAFAEQALPARLAALAPGQSLRILSAGCASGDEPYSLAMVVHERCPQALGRMSLRAVDVNAAALARARAGRYTAWSLRQLPAPLRERWFRPIAGAGGDFLLDRALREAVRFEWHNLADEDRQLWQDGAWDIVFCRNMMMYFTPERMHALVQRIERSLAPGGYLFLGHAETLRGLPSALRLCHSHGCFYYQREPVPAAPPMGSAWQPGPAASPPASLGAAAAIDPHWVDTVQQAHSRIGALAASARELAGTPPRATDLGPAYEALRAERFDLALQHLGALPPAQTNAADVLLLRAASLAHLGSLPEAERACAQLLQRGEALADAHYVQALCRDAAGLLAEAMAQDRIAANLDTVFSMPHLHLGLLARRQGQSGLARSELALAMQLLEGEDPTRLLLFGGGFDRAALIALCQAELAACMEHS